MGVEIDRMCCIELQNRGAPHVHLALIFVDDTYMNDVILHYDKVLQELGASFREDKSFLIPLHCSNEYSIHQSICQSFECAFLIPNLPNYYFPAFDINKVKVFLRGGTNILRPIMNSVQ